MRSILRKILWVMYSLLFLGLVAEYARSFWFHDRFNYHPRASRLANLSSINVNMGSGILILDRQKATSTEYPLVPHTPVPSHWEFGSRRIDRDQPANWGYFNESQGIRLLWTFGVEKKDRFYDFGFGNSMTYYERGVCFPCWVLLVPMGLVLGIRIKGVVERRRRLRDGLCMQCGYDLRATSDRCPECGAMIHLETGN